MSISVEDIIKEAMSKSKATTPANTDVTKLAEQLESLANSEAETFIQSENEKESKKEKIREFIDTLAEVI